MKTEDSGKTITSDVIEMPAIGLGTWQLEGKDAEEAVGMALDAGYRHIDTAQVYDNEEHVGKALAHAGRNRGDIFVTTKIWTDNFSPSSFMDSLKKSLEKLQTDYVDLLLLHWPSEDADMQLTFAELDSALEQGLTKHIGVSNFTKAWLTDGIGDHLKNPVAVNQVEYHPFLDQATVLELCRKKGIVLTAYSPLARGEVLADETLKRIALRHGKSPAQVSLRWLNQQNVVAIPKGSGKEHIESNIDIFDFELDEGEMKTISGLGSSNGRKIDPSFAPEWD